MQIASAMAGYTLGEADILRRAMGKKKKEVMAAERTKFVEGAKRNKVPAKVAGEVFDLMEHFAGYGFNASHSAAYALIAYRTAYLKAHHPREFMAALLSIEKDITDNVARYLHECREMGIRVLPPDINESAADFTVQDDAVRYGLAAIKKVGESAVASIVEGRRKVGRYVSLTQLCAEIDTRLANKGVVEALVKAGAFDGYGVSRERLLAAVDSAMDSAQRLSRARASGQGGLFGGDSGDTGSVPRDTYPQSSAEWSDLERLQAEREALGFYFSGHPLSRFKEDLEGVATHGSATLGQAGQGAEVSVGGMMAGVTRRKTRKGDTMATFTLEDLEGGVEVVVFPDLYAKSQPLFMEDSPVLVTGRVEADETRTRILASEMVALSDARQSRTGSVSIRMPVAGLTGEIVERLKGVLADNRGACPVYFELTDPGAYALTLKADGAFASNASRRMVASLEAILGPGSVRLRSRTGRASGSARPAPVRDA